jgi:hypothetical protein
MTSYGPDTRARPPPPEQTTIEAGLAAEGAQTRLVWEERGMPVDQLPACGTGIQIHVEHLGNHLGGRQLRDAEALWAELFPAYEALGVS